MNDEEFNRRFGTPTLDPIKGWILIVLIFAAALGVWLYHMPRAAASTVCDPVDRESLITDAIVDGQDRVWRFEGDGAKTFMKSIENLGLIFGVSSNVTKIYVIEYKTKYVVFFLKDDCILDARDFLKKLLQGVLP